jgi:predicted GNAT superfamily acetyltransferase
MTGVEFRDLSGMEEFRAAEDLQREVWGPGDQPDPADLMMVIQSEGGLVGGAFAQGRLMGYVFAFPTAEAGVQHSHRLAVHGQARGMGLGLRLKLWQRDWARARGLRLIRWTYDPLRAVNAGLNIARLGATAGTYLPDYYGAMEGINRGLPSDRLLVEWEVAPQGARAEGAALDLPLPDDLEALVARDPAAALALRLALRAGLTRAFAEGRRITGFDRARRVYLLG